MFVYIVIEDNRDFESEICGVYSNLKSAENKKSELEAKNLFPRIFSYRVEEKVPVWD